MYSVYILYSKTFDKTYAGFTSDLDARLVAHNHPQNKGFTKRFQPWEIAYSESYATKAGAMQRELWYKTGVGRGYMENQLIERGYRKN